MPKFAANVSTMYHEYAVADRFRAAAEDGFEAVEFLNPYGFEITEIQSWLSQNQLKLILINTRPGLEGEATIGLAAIPGRQPDFKTIFSEALNYARELGAPMIHVLAGVVAAFDPKEVKETFLANISWAAAQASTHGITIMLEPLNTQDVPGYFYTSSHDVAQLIDELGIDNVKLQYDLYHMQIMEGNLTHHITQLMHQIGHIQFSSVPGRFEPQYGEVNLPQILEHLDQAGYEGWIGCEYSARTHTRDGLSWATEYRLGGADKNQ